MLDFVLLTVACWLTNKTKIKGDEKHVNDW